MNEPTIPRDIESLVNRAAELQATRRELSAQLSAVKKQESELEAELLRKLDGAKLEGCKTTRAHAVVTAGKNAVIEDWNRFEEFILEHRAFDLLQRRVAKQAYQLRIDDGVDVPGLTMVPTRGVKITPVAAAKT